MSNLAQFLICLKRHSAAVTKFKRATYNRTDRVSIGIRGITSLDRDVASARDSVAFYARHCRSFASLINAVPSVRPCYARTTV